MLKEIPLWLFITSSLICQIDQAVALCAKMLDCTIVMLVSDSCDYYTSHVDCGLISILSIIISD